MRYDQPIGPARVAPAPPRPRPAPRPPGDTRLWAVLQEAIGGIWAGCVYDPERIAGAVEGANGGNSVQNG